MLSQFKNRYPQGNLISELIKKDSGKYIIRAKIIVDRITLATGMAADETIEFAEYRAKKRALAGLALNNPTTNKPQKNRLIKSESWQKVLAEEIKKDYFIKLLNFVETERQQQTIFPPKQETFAALEITPLEKVKVVILGQDPYHQRTSTRFEFFC